MQYKDGQEEAYMQWKAKHEDDMVGSAIFRYAERLANLIEMKMEEYHYTPEETLKKFGEILYHEADEERITGTMAYYAKGVLINCWKYGDEFKDWLEYQNEHYRDKYKY